MKFSTRCSPAKLVFGWKICTKIPQLTLQVIRQEIHNWDAEIKGVTKLYADKKRHGKEPDIMHSDQELLNGNWQNEKMNTPCFSKPYTLIKKRLEVE